MFLAWIGRFLNFNGMFRGQTPTQFRQIRIQQNPLFDSGRILKIIGYVMISFALAQTSVFYSLGSFVRIFYQFTVRQMFGFFVVVTPDFVNILDGKAFANH